MPVRWPMLRARVVKRGPVWSAFGDDGFWMGDSSYWGVALAMALGESVNDARRAARVKPVTP